MSKNEKLWEFVPEEFPVSEFEWPDKPNRARQHKTLRDAFVAFTESHPELVPCNECAEAFLRGDEHPAGADALFACMTDREPYLDPDVLGPILAQFFTFNAWRYTFNAQRPGSKAHTPRTAN